jgi:hypothetical protein
MKHKCLIYPYLTTAAIVSTCQQNLMSHFIGSIHDLKNFRAAEGVYFDNRSLMDRARTTAPTSQDDLIIAYWE